MRTTGSYDTQKDVKNAIDEAADALRSNPTINVVFAQSITHVCALGIQAIKTMCSKTYHAGELSVGVRLLCTTQFARWLISHNLLVRLMPR